MAVTPAGAIEAGLEQARQVAAMYADAEEALPQRIAARVGEDLDEDNGDDWAEKRLAEARLAGLLHPNCGHSLNAYLPGCPGRRPWCSRRRRTRTPSGSATWSGRSGRTGRSLRSPSMRRPQ
jgi:hypothetical protein